MQLAIDDLENGKESKRGLKAAKEIEKERKKKSKSKKKYAEKAVESKRNTGESRDLVDGVIRAVEIEQDSLVVKVMGDHVLSIEQDTTDLTEVIKSK